MKSSVCERGSTSKVVRCPVGVRIVYCFVTAKGREGNARVVRNVK